jgi:adenine C2-methylase RlmN of 23S rRNA A2503 and tRNA A37
MTSSAVGRRRRRRTGPAPLSVLNRAALVQALDDQGTPLKPIHVEAFYQWLHRWQYPEPKEFVQRVRQLAPHHKTTTSIAAVVVNDENVSHNPRAVSLDASRMPTTTHISSTTAKPQFPQFFLDFLHTSPFVTLTSRIQSTHTSSDGSTTKFAIELYDGQVVESVVMRYQPSPETGAGGTRISLCVSSQCGCAMGCTFCATGTMGWSGQLSTGEILEQIIHAERFLLESYHNNTRIATNDKEALGATKNSQKQHNLQSALTRVRNIVFMGMGEPLDNYSAVVAACRIFMERHCWNLASGRVTISTVGLVAQIRQLTRDLPHVSIALSLHAPTQETRQAIVPVAKRYPLPELLQALEDHVRAYVPNVPPHQQQQNSNTTTTPISLSHRRRAMIEYVMIEGPTSTLEAAHQVGQLCQGRPLVINLIPYNPTNVQDPLACPSWDHIQTFRSIVGSYGLFCTIRRTMGADIDSACGQLVRSTTTTTAAVGEEEEKKEHGDPIESTVVVEQKETGVARKEALVTDMAVADTKESRQGSPPIVAATIIDDDALDMWIQSLQVATAVAATCFVVSSWMCWRHGRLTR